MPDQQGRQWLLQTSGRADLTGFASLPVFASLYCFVPLTCVCDESGAQGVIKPVLPLLLGRYNGWARHRLVELALSQHATGIQNCKHRRAGHYTLIIREQCKETAQGPSTQDQQGQRIRV